jgi:hypothetical protein
MISLRGQQYKYIHHLETDAGELYDWHSDPQEGTDLSTEHPEIARQLRAELLDFYEDLVKTSRSMSKPQVVDMSPKRIKQLKSLGYIR